MLSRFIFFCAMIFYAWINSTYFVGFVSLCRIKIDKVKSKRKFLNEKLDGLREVKRRNEKLLYDNQLHIDLLESRIVTLHHELSEVSERDFFLIC